MSSSNSVRPFAALRTAALATVCVGGLAACSAEKPAETPAAGSSPAGEKGCGEKGCGEKGCGEKGCGEKGGGEKSCSAK